MALHINDIPDPVLIKIFSYLEQAELRLSASRVCKRWDSLCYDRDLWRCFNQQKYEGYFNGLIDTTGFQRYILQRVRSYIRHVTLTEEGLVLLPFLDKLGMQNLQSLTLPLDYDTIVSDPYLIRHYKKVLTTVRTIHKSTGAQIYGEQRKDYLPLMHFSLFMGIQCPWNKHISICMSDTRLSVCTGIENMLHFSDWDSVGECLKTNHHNYHSLTLHDVPYYNQIIPSSVLHQIAEIESLQQLSLRCCMQGFEELTESQLNQLCKNLLSLEVDCASETTSWLRNLIHRSHSVRSLCIYDGSAPWIYALPQTCKQLTDLCLRKIAQLADPRNSVLLCDIAHNCTELKRVMLDDVHGKIVNSFLQKLPKNCAKIISITLWRSSPLFDYPIEKNTMIQLFNGCPLLKTLHNNQYNIGGDDTLNLPNDFQGNVSLEALHIVADCSSIHFLSTGLQELGNMEKLTVLQLVGKKGSFVYGSTVKIICKMCPNLEDLALAEFSGECEDKDCAILDEMCFHLQKKLRLKLMLKSDIRAKNVVKLLQRTPSLVQLSLCPVSIWSAKKVQSCLEIGQHKLDLQSDRTMKLTLLSKVAFKQLTAAQGENSATQCNN